MSGRNGTAIELFPVRMVILAITVAIGVFITSADVASASNVVVGLSEDRGDITVPTWLYLATGAGVVGASALLTMLVTDRDVIEDYHGISVDLPLERVLTIGSVVGGVLGLTTLALVIIVAVIGPSIGLVSATVLVTFVLVRSILTIVAYTIGNPWNALNPWRHIASVFPHQGRTYPAWVGRWPAVGLLLGFIWLEVIAPLSSAPRILLVVILAYTVLTLGGAIVFTPETWFEHGDPLTVWFRLYGSVAPIQRTANGIEWRFPGSRLSDDDVVPDLSSVAFVLVLVWELTYSGFIVTPPGILTIETLVAIGFPPELIYLLLLVSGFIVFCGVYWFAAGRVRHRAQTYLSQRYIACRYAPPLIAIAAGYHIAHYVGFSIQLWPQLIDSLSSPLNPDPNPTQYVLTPWFGYVEIAGILIGHILAVWIAHTISFELFPGKLQAIRSQYPFIIVMIFFTMVSLYLVSLPTSSPPYVPQ